jgi:hypothetical protein
MSDERIERLAGQALAGLLANPTLVHIGEDLTGKPSVNLMPAGSMAAFCVQYARAVVAELDAPPKKPNGATISLVRS